MEGNLISDGEFETMNYCTADIEKSFLSFIENPKYISRMNKNITCILCTEELSKTLPAIIKGVFIVDEPKYSFHKLNQKFACLVKLEKFKTIIGENCDINEKVNIPKYNVIIGNNVTIESFVTISENVIIKDDCIIHSNAVIGGKSFSAARGNNGDICGLIDRGQVVLEKGVEIFSGTHIAQGVWESDVTYIGENTKIDALVHIGHGARIGKSVLIAAGAVIGGNTILQDNTWVGINASVSNRLNIEREAKVSLGAVVTKDVAQNEIVTGNFAIEHSKFIKELKEKINR